MKKWKMKPQLRKSTEEEQQDLNTQEPSSTEELIERVNFKETQLFTKFIKTKKGKYSGSFKLTDLITRFQFTIDAVSSKGVYGALTSTFDSNKAFFVESNIPLFLTNGDKISVPVVITNNNPISVNVDLDRFHNIPKSRAVYPCFRLRNKSKSLLTQPSQFR